MNSYLFRFICLFTFFVVSGVNVFAQDYDYDPSGYVYGYYGDHNIEVKIYNFSSSSHRTKFRVRKHDGNDFGSSATIYIHIDSPNGNIVEDINVSSGDSYGTSGYYYFDDDVTDQDGRDYYATLTVGGFTHKAGPINIFMSEPNRLETPSISSPNNGEQMDLPISIDWNSVSGADVYRVVISESKSGFDDDPSGDSPFQNDVYNNTTTSSSITIPAGYLQPNTTYYVSVRAGSYTIYHSLFCSPVSFFVKPLPTYKIQGKVKDSNGSGLGGVVLSYSDGLSYTTNSTGLYLKNVPSGNDLTITPSKSGYTFSPSNHSYNNVSQNYSNQDFVGTPDPVYYTISGYVKTASGEGISGVSVSISGSGSVTTSASGYYSKQVLKGSSGTITPSKSGYTFSPSSKSFSNLSVSLSQNFTGTPPVSYYTVSGYIKTSDGTAISGVTVTFSGNGSVTTNSSGHYSKSLQAGTSGTITPSKSGYTFDPSTHAFSGLAGNYTKDFTAIADPVYFTISGSVTVDGVGLEGVSMEFSNEGTVITNAEGFYTVEVDRGHSGTATPSKAGYIFSPISRNYTNVNQNFTDDYTAQTLQAELYKLPFPANITMYITDSYGEGLHKPENNDFYCVDFNLSGNSDFGIPVLACRDGVVIFASWSAYGYRVKVDHGDGVISNYSHGTYISVFVGEHVKQGQELMMLWNSTPDPNGFMPHLHYGLRQWDSLQNKHVSMELPNHSGYSQFSPKLSSGYLSDNEYYVPGKMVEESDNPVIGNYFGESNLGHFQRYKYAKCVDGNSTVVSRWVPEFSSQKTVEIFVCVPGDGATTSAALYKIYHLNGVATVPINQYSYDQPSQNWVSLGTYTFSAGNSHYVELGNSVSDFDPATPKYVGFDAIYFRDINEGGGYDPVVTLRINSLDITTDQITEDSHINLETIIQNSGSVNTIVVKESFAFTEVGNRNNIIQCGDTSVFVPISSGQEKELTYDIGTPSFGQYDLIYSVITSGGDSISWVQPISVHQVTGVSDSREVPKDFALLQNYPNPFNPTTEIQYEIPEESLVEISVYNLLGEAITTLVNETKPAGQYTVTFNANSLANGLYLCRFKAGNHIFTRKMILLK